MIANLRLRLSYLLALSAGYSAQRARRMRDTNPRSRQAQLESPFTTAVTSELPAKRDRFP